ncbi:MAG: hypothetical protein Tsb0013_08200 [Phycisphaerales bacterium]
MSVVAFSARRTIGITVLLASCAIAWGVCWVADTALVRDHALATGIALLTLCLLLALFNGRKKVPFLPLLSGAAWLQFHIYAGLFSGMLFLLHISFRWPSGVFETALAALFALTFLSGLFGLFISRRLPKRLTRRGEQVLFERIPAHRRTIMERAEAVVERGVTESGARAVADFYEDNLRSFFLGGRNFYAHLFQSNAPRHRVLTSMDEHKRYLNEGERAVMDELRILVEQKDDLDFQHACQTLLKLWLFVHIPLTFALLVFAAVHTLLVLTYRPLWS